MQRKLTRHLLICINSFNKNTYVKSALKLVQQVQLELAYGGIKFSILCVFGGCDKYEFCTVQNSTFMSIPQNLSDHNIYRGIAYHADTLPEKATCIMLHDTCQVKTGQFRKMMMKLSRFNIENEWIFAHALGLYNIGICDMNFAKKHAQNWVGIDYLDKNTSYKLEHTRETIDVAGKHVPGLRSYSNKTLNPTKNNRHNFNDLDFHSIIPFFEEGNTNHHRHVVYLGAIGVYKFTHTPGSYLLPIWVNEFMPSTQTEYDLLSSNVHVKQNEWIRALIPYSPTFLKIDEVF